jgi:hypothetical protein
MNEYTVQLPHDTTIARRPPRAGKQCVIHVHWTPDENCLESHAREWFTVHHGALHRWQRPAATGESLVPCSQMVTVHFTDGKDLLQQVNRLYRAGRWWTVNVSAPDMGDHHYMGTYRSHHSLHYLTMQQEVYSMGSVSLTLNVFASKVDRYCNERVAFIRKVLNEPERAVRVEIQLHVLEYAKENWGCANYTDPWNEEECHAVLN